VVDAKVSAAAADTIAAFRAHANNEIVHWTGRPATSAHPNVRRRPVRLDLATPPKTSEAPALPASSDSIAKHDEMLPLQSRSLRSAAGAQASFARSPSARQAVRAAAPVCG